MPLGNFGSSIDPNVSNRELADLVSRLIKEVTYLLNGGLDTLNVNELSADVINAGVLNALLVKIAAANGGNSLTIDQNGMTANNGSVDTMKFDLATGLLTIVSAIIKSAAGYPMIAFNLNNNIMQAFSDANNHVDISPSSGGSPGMAWYVANALAAYLNCTSAGPLLASFNSTPVTIQPATDLNLSITGGSLKINNTPGYSGTFTYVRNVISDGAGGYMPITGQITVTKGLITNVT